LEPHYEATRNDPDPEKIPRVSFDLLNLCAKFQSHIWTGSTSIREAKCLFYIDFELTEKIKLFPFELTITCHRFP
jgi:hypothetical protein